jgi:hypothetical protein
MQKTTGGSNEAVPVSVGIVAEGEVEAVLKFDQPCHGKGLAQSLHDIPVAPLRLRQR